VTYQCSEWVQHFTDNAEDYAYYTVKGASVFAIRTVFTDSVYAAIEQSDLRAWEMEQRLIDTTDCLLMEINREVPHHGRIRLRTAYHLTMLEIVNVLYA
jgi:hypothetical protein